MIFDPQLVTLAIERGWATKPAQVVRPRSIESRERRERLGLPVSVARRKENWALTKEEKRKRHLAKQRECMKRLRRNRK